MKNLAIEIGTEEIPADALNLASDYLCKKCAELLKESRVEHGAIKVLCTPRRLILKVDDVAEETTSLTQEYKGPACDRAYDESGNPTKAALGFAKGKGVDASELERRSVDGTEYVFATINKPSQQTYDLLGTISEQLISTIPWKKSQRWGSCSAHFSRPVRWLVGLFGSDIVNFEFAELKSGRTTYGHRFLAPSPIELSNADELVPSLEKAYVVCDQTVRANKIREQIAVAEKETGLVASVPKGTFEEVLGLVEYPTVLVGHFDEEFLQVPPEIITDAMLSHQRYFPLYTKDNKLSNAFIVVSNGDPKCSKTITEGNERVVRARLADAAFFYNEDLKRPLESYVDDLANQVFQEKLGTMKQKTERMVVLAQKLAADAGLDAATSERCARAALLAKADLVTNAVVEFTSQQGVMGGYYARAAHEPDEVALAVEQHYRPKFAGDELPQNDEGKIVAIADKLDTIAGLFAIGQPPTGSKDPFALRRGAIGIIAILQSGLHIDLTQAINDAIAGYTNIEFDRAAATNEVVDFFAGRLNVIAKEKGYEAEVVNSVLATGVINPVEVLARCDALSAARKNNQELYEDLETAYKRANNLRDADLGTEFDESIAGSEEKELATAVIKAQNDVDASLEAGNYSQALVALAQLRGPIDAFFDAVMIMDKDETIRNNHLKLLNSFVSVFSNVADFEKLGG